MEPNSSSTFALRFPAGPFQVVVEPSFWLITALLGWSNRLDQVAAWVVICFFSILVHELGHAIANRAFGAAAWIRLYSFGGLCYADRRLSKWRDIAVSLAGPFAGFCLGGVAVLAGRAYPPDNPFGRFCLLQAVWVNMGWGLVNLLPVLPLDGGHVLARLLGDARRKLMTWISAGVGGGAAVAAYYWLRDPYVALLMAWLGLQSLALSNPGTAQKPKPRAPTPEEKDGVRLGWEALARGDEQEAIRLARGALHRANGPEAATAARDLLAWAAIAEGNAALALDYLRSSPPERTRALSWALAYEAAELCDRALPFAEKAMDEEPSEASATALLRILVALERREDAERLLREYPWQKPERAAGIVQAHRTGEPVAG